MFSRGAPGGRNVPWHRDVGPLAGRACPSVDVDYAGQVSAGRVHGGAGLPPGVDLVCSRLTLFWLAGRQEQAIRRMVECLRPGGWLVDEDGDWGTAGPVDPSHPLYAGYHRSYQAGGWFASRGYDPFFGRKLAALFERCGLENIGHHATADVVRGNSPWALWWRDTLQAIGAWGLAGRAS